MAFQVLQRLTAIKSNSFQTRLGRRVACVSVRSAAAIVTRAGPRTAVLFCSGWWRGVLNSVTEHWPQFEFSHRQDEVSSLGASFVRTPFNTVEEKTRACLVRLAGGI